MNATTPPAEKVTLATLGAMKRAGRKIVMLTCYDYPFATVLDQAGVDAILVGDSAAQVVYGHSSTLPATMDMLVPLACAVRRGAPRVFLVGDMPYLSYHVSPQEAIRNAGRFMAEAGCDAVKLECDVRLAPTVAALTAATIPVIVHLGLLPQAVHRLGGYRAQARDAESADRLIRDAVALVEAGACMVLLEAVPPEPARIVAQRVAVPVIGCGAGPHCDGHVVVLHDMLGLSEGPLPRFVKKYGDLRRTAGEAVTAYVGEVRAGGYPAASHQYEMEPGAAERLRATWGP